MMPENTTEGRLIAAETAQSLVPVHFRSIQLKPPRYPHFVRLESHICHVLLVSVDELAHCHLDNWYFV